ncbi:MAG: DUF5667 domain-containing protein, partial [Dehalococcoidales bacterium]|nr:DUF5667 domain-containing protein [Dehalococcoidales bacterium]
MKQGESFNNLLNECIERIMRGETVEECLRRYPEQAEELKPLLQTVLKARQVSQIQPEAGFKSRARQEFQRAIYEKQASRREKAGWWHWRWQSAWAMAIIAVLIVLLGGGAVVAAAGSMPDNPLYPVKLAAEQIQLSLTFSDIGKAELNAKLADERVNELVYLAEKGDGEKVKIVADRLNSNLQNIVNIVGEINVKNASTQDSVLTAQQAQPDARSAPEPAGIITQTAPATTVPPTTSVPSPTQPEISNQPRPATSAPPMNEDTSSEPVLKHDFGLKALQPAPSTSNSKGLEELKKKIINYVIEHPAKLEEALQKAPPELRPVLRETIMRALAEYEEI